jgi:Domain of unknown function (DUF5666)
MKNKLGILIAGASIAGSLLVAGTAFAAGPQGIYGPQNQGQGQGQMWGGRQGGPEMGGMRPGVFGSVTAISGDTLTVQSKGFGRNASSTPATTYTVDASSATVFKDNATSTLSSVAVGDTVMVQGTVSGDSVTATTIRDGLVPQMGGMPGRGGMGGHASSTPPYIPQGNGEPVVGGSVTAISGSTLTITNQAGATYTIDASSAAVSDKGATSTVSSIAVGDNVVVQGSVNGSSVTASSIIDQGAQKGGSGTMMHTGMGAIGGNIIGAIGGFFKHIFGFF